MAARAGRVRCGHATGLRGGVQGDHADASNWRKLPRTGAPRAIGCPTYAYLRDARTERGIFRTHALAVRSPPRGREPPTEEAPGSGDASTEGPHRSPREAVGDRHAVLCF